MNVFCEKKERKIEKKKRKKRKKRKKEQKRFKHSLKMTTEKEKVNEVRKTCQSHL